MRWSRQRAVVTGLVVVALAGVAALGVLTMRDHPEQQFCTAGLGFVEVDGVAYATEDQGAAGDDNCDLSDDFWPGDPYQGDQMMAPGYVGFDCHLHLSDDETSADTVLAPNRSDGTCSGAGP